MVDPLQKAKAELLLASFDFGQAQRALEDAEARFRKALNAVDFLEDQPWPSMSPAESHPVEIVDAGQSFQKPDLAGKIER